MLASTVPHWALLAATLGLIARFRLASPEDVYPAGNKSGIDLNDRDGVAIQRRVIPKMQR